MNKQELAQGLIGLWGEFVASKQYRFAPTMTDFMHWLRDNKVQQDEQEVKAARTSREIVEYVGEAKSSVVQLSEAALKAIGNIEFSVAQQPGSDAESSALTTADKVRIKELYAQGYSAARIRQMLNLKTPLGTIYSIANKR